MPILDRDRTVWRDYHDIDTSLRAIPYEELDLHGMDAFEVIGRDARSAP
jgi:hypothetical protein